MIMIMMIKIILGIKTKAFMAIAIICLTNPSTIILTIATCLTISITRIFRPYQVCNLMFKTN